MFADFQKIRDAGYAPLAVGSQPFEVGYLTHALVAAVAGPDIYKKIYGEEARPDRARRSELCQGARNTAALCQ